MEFFLGSSDVAYDEAYIASVSVGLSVPDVEREQKISYFLLAQPLFSRKAEDYSFGLHTENSMETLVTHATYNVS